MGGTSQEENDATLSVRIEWENSIKKEMEKREREREREEKNGSHRKTE